jgi:hypothetical protein
MYLIFKNHFDKLGKKMATLVYLEYVVLEYLE